MSSKAVTWGVVSILAALFIYWQYTNYAHNNLLNSNLGNKHSLSARVAAASELIDRKQFADVLPTTTPYTHFWVIDALQQIARDTAHKDRAATALTQLVGLMKDPSEDTRGKAQRELVELGPIALPGVVTALGDADPHANKGAVSTMTRIGRAYPAKTIACLVDAVVNQPTERNAAVDALVALTPRATPDMLKLLYNKDKDVRSAAADYFGDTGMLPGLKQTSGENRLLALLQDKDVRPAAMRAEGLLGDKRALPEIVKALTSTADAAHRRTAIVALGDMRAASTVSMIVPFLKDRDPDIRTVAEVALHAMGPAGAPALASAFRAPDWLTRKGVADSLMNDTSAEGLSILKAALHDPDSRVRTAAATSLGTPGFAAAVPPLIGSLSDPSADVAEAAETSLGQVGTPAIKPLIAVLGVGGLVSSDAKVSTMASTEMVVSYYASRALTAIGTDAAGPVVAAARSGALASRAWAIITLADLKTPAAVPVLQQIARSGPPDLRWYAKDSLRGYQA